MKIILASQSPRRRELLSLITADFEVRPADADETLPEGASPEESVRALALRKAEAVCRTLSDAERAGTAVIGSDTLVYCGGEPLGKPTDKQDAARMLAMLSGRSHAVYTGAAVLAPGGSEVFCSRTEVEFYPLEEAMIARYCATGEPMDKAGAYGIQGGGGLLVRAIRGDYFTVMGLPVAELCRAMLRLGVIDAPNFAAL